MYQLSLTFALNIFAIENVRIFGLARASSRALPRLLPAHLPLILFVHHCFGCSAIPLAGTNAMLFVPTELTTGPAAKFAGHKTKEIWFLELRRPFCQWFCHPFSLSFGPVWPKK